jgi:hypothetical protein
MTNKYDPFRFYMTLTVLVLVSQLEEYRCEKQLFKNMQVTCLPSGSFVLKAKK